MDSSKVHGFSGIFPDALEGSPVAFSFSGHNSHDGCITPTPN